METKTILTGIIKQRTNMPSIKSGISFGKVKARIIRKRKIDTLKDITMKTLKKILRFLSGKKTTIGSAIALVITYLLTKGYIDSDLAILFNSLLLVFGLTANIATNKLIYNK